MADRLFHERPELSEFEPITRKKNISWPTHWIRNCHTLKRNRLHFLKCILILGTCRKVYHDGRVFGRFVCLKVFLYLRIVYLNSHARMNVCKCNRWVVVVTSGSAQVCKCFVIVPSVKQHHSCWCVVHHFEVSFS